MYIVKERKFEFLAILCWWHNVADLHLQKTQREAEFDCHERGWVKGMELLD